MNGDLALDTHAISIANYLNQARGADAAAADFRTMAGRELIRAKALIDRGETSLTWTSWCEQHVKRSTRDIRRLMALAGATDPTQAREREKARNRAAKPAGSRSVSPFQAHDEGVGAFLRGVSQEACPYTDRQRHAAWRKGWSETQGRTGASPAAAPLQPTDGVRDASSELRRASERLWPMLSRADQERLIDWFIDHMSDRDVGQSVRHARESEAKDLA